MATISERINRRLMVLRENAQDISWKDPSSPNYDRQVAETALFHTIGPLMENPRWAARWTGTPDGVDAQPVPGFTPGGPAPRWSENEITIAYAGDPKFLHSPGSRDHPRSPSYGNRGGAPLYRMARQLARKYKREKDPGFIDELYQNGLVELVRLMKPGNDQGRSAFISWVSRNVEGAMEHGTSGTGEEAIKAKGDVSKDTGLIGLQGLLKSATPEEARKVAAQVKGQFQHTRLHDKHPDNPFGAYSSQIFALASNYAQAMEDGNEELVKEFKAEIAALIDKIEEDKGMLLGASTGIGQAVSTQDRATSVGVASMDMPTSDGTGTMGDSIGQAETEGLYSGVDSERIQLVLQYALSTDIGAEIGNDREFMEKALAFGLKPGDQIGGPLSATEYRVLLRKLGHLGGQYPGKGRLRQARTVPRDAKGWWSPGEDPEMEPIPEGGVWRSIWTRTGNPESDDTDIFNEFAEEYKEFLELGINGVDSRMQAAKAGKAPLSKVSIGKAKNSAFVKIKLAAELQRLDSGVNESLVRRLRARGFTFLEDYDPIDRRLLTETWNFIIAKLAQSIIAESMVTDTDRRMVYEDIKINWSVVK